MRGVKDMRGMRGMRGTRRKAASTIVVQLALIVAVVSFSAILFHAAQIATEALFDARAFEDFSIPFVAFGDNMIYIDVINTGTISLQIERVLVNAEDVTDRASLPTLNPGELGEVAVKYEYYPDEAYTIILISSRGNVRYAVAQSPPA